MEKFGTMRPRVEEEPALMVDAFVSRLAKALSEKISYEEFDDTYEIDTDTFGLTFTLDEDTFEIRNIDTRGTSGIGGQIVGAIHDYADAAGLEVIASNVKDTAQGFWRKMGYEERDDEEWYRVN